MKKMKKKNCSRLNNKYSKLSMELKGLRVKPTCFCIQTDIFIEDIKLSIWKFQIFLNNKKKKIRSYMNKLIRLLGGIIYDDILDYFNLNIS